MKINAKSLSKGKTTTTIKVEHNKLDDATSSEINALYALLGGYNQVARHVDLDKFKQIQSMFNDAISELTWLIK